MQAVLMHSYGGPDVLIYGEHPDPTVGPGEVLVRVAATSINPFDIKLRSGALNDFMPMTFPSILGVDVSGVVETVGPGVQGFSPGDRVFAHAMRTYASYCVVKASDLAHVPDGLDLVAAAALPTVTTTGAQLAERALGTLTAARLFVGGAVGNVGRSAIFAARRRGARIVAGVLRRQVDKAMTLGVDEVVALDDAASLEALAPVDAIADTLGGAVADLLLGKVKPGGTFATVLGPPATAPQHPSVRVDPIEVKASPSLLVTLAQAVQSGELTIPEGPRYALREAPQAHAAAERGGAGKLLLVP